MTRKPTGVEQHFADKEIIVSKTDLKGIITYANSVFARVSKFSEIELMGKPHNIVRHPDMPRGVFKLLWDRLEGGHEVFALVLNMCRDGDHYWVLAHVTPSYNAQGKITGYHSNRRCPCQTMIRAILPIYQQMLELEAGESNPKTAAANSLAFLMSVLNQNNISYDEFIFDLLNRVYDGQLSVATKGVA